MSKIRVDARLVYDVRQTTAVCLNIAAATAGRQELIEEHLCVNPMLQTDHCCVGPEGNRVYRFVVEPCRLQIDYSATVGVNPIVNNPSEVGEVGVAEIPPAVLPYLYPSRYCQCDLLMRFAFEEFAGVPSGYRRANEICDWVCSHLNYAPGSTNSATTATDVLLQRNGVCRDYAHLAIALLRAAGIPARYVSGYAVGLQPPDFHGFLEAFLDGGWYLFDPTKLARLDQLVRIGTGRDAADVAFATLSGDAILEEKSVWAQFVESDQTGHGSQQTSAVSTA
jgi:transglutaminase-like putative cysteine protease